MEARGRQFVHFHPNNNLVLSIGQMVRLISTASGDLPVFHSENRVLVLRNNFHGYVRRSGSGEPPLSSRCNERQFFQGRTICRISVLCWDDPVRSVTRHCRIVIDAGPISIPPFNPGPVITAASRPAVS